MSARRIVTGCAVAAGVFLVFLIIGGVVAYRHLAAPAPIPPAARLADASSLGLGVVHLEPDDPWVRGTYAELSKYSTREAKPADLFPLELVWAARHAPQGPAPEAHILALSFSRNGLLFGMAGDFALWRAGRSDSGKVARVEHHGEGITSFPGTSIPGSVFIRSSTITWTSDLDTAKAAVDLAIAAEAAEAAAPGGAGGAAQAPILARLPSGARHAVEGAILNEDGSLARILGLAPGGVFDLPASEFEAVSSLSFTFDATSPTEGIGTVTLDLGSGASPGQARAIAEDLAARLLRLTIMKVVFEAVPRAEPGRATIMVKATGLDSIRAPLIEKMVASMKGIEALQKEGPAGKVGGDAPPADPNQSSSTFQ